MGATQVKFSEGILQGISRLYTRSVLRGAIKKRTIITIAEEKFTSDETNLKKLSYTSKLVLLRYVKVGNSIGSITARKERVFDASPKSLGHMTFPRMNIATNTAFRKKSLIHLTPAATAQLKKLMRPDDEYSRHIRIYTKKGGCAGDSYQLDYVPKPEKLDELFEVDGISIVIDAKALLKVIGCQIDYVETPVGSEFVFKNPNAKEVCGCGQSFKL